MSATEVTDVAEASTLSSGPLGGFSKRFVDVSVALAMLVLLAPLILLAGVAVRCSGRGPVFFSHTRLGFNGQPFGCLKIRTMVPDSARVLADMLASNPTAALEWAESQKLRDDPRITTVGRLLRRTSIDELPQLLNVLRGDMSLVGPRPIVAAEVERYGARFSCYQVARPGITGLWQVGGRSNCSYAERIAYDAQYVNNWSLGNDVVILLRTVKTVVFSKDSF